MAPCSCAKTQKHIFRKLKQRIIKACKGWCRSILSGILKVDGWLRGCYEDNSCDTSYAFSNKLFGVSEDKVVDPLSSEISEETDNCQLESHFSPLVKSSEDKTGNNAQSLKTENCEISRSFETSNANRRVSVYSTRDPVISSFFDKLRSKSYLFECESDDEYDSGEYKSNFNECERTLEFEGKSSECVKNLEQMVYDTRKLPEVYKDKIKNTLGLLPPPSFPYQTSSLNGIPAYTLPNPASVLEPLPPNWEERPTLSGGVYYVNCLTRCAQFERPSSGVSQNEVNEMKKNVEKLRQNLDRSNVFGDSKVRSLRPPILLQPPSPPVFPYAPPKPATIIVPTNQKFFSQHQLNEIKKNTENLKENLDRSYSLGDSKVRSLRPPILLQPPSPPAFPYTPPKPATFIVPSNPNVVSQHQLNEIKKNTENLKQNLDCSNSLGAHENKFNSFDYNIPKVTDFYPELSAISPFPYPYDYSDIGLPDYTCMRSPSFLAPLDNKELSDVLLKRNEQKQRRLHSDSKLFGVSGDKLMNPLKSESGLTSASGPDFPKVPGFSESRPESRLLPGFSTNTTSSLNRISSHTPEKQAMTPRIFYPIDLPAFDNVPEDSTESLLASQDLENVLHDSQKEFKNIVGLDLEVNQDGLLAYSYNQNSTEKKL